MQTRLVVWQLVQSDSDIELGPIKTAFECEPFGAPPGQAEPSRAKTNPKTINETARRKGEMLDEANHTHFIHQKSSN